jgi:hypothetical protein
MRGLPVGHRCEYAERMPTPAAILLALVGALNDSAEPYSFQVTGMTIVGQWDVLHAEYREHGEAGGVDETYRITVDINEKKGTYSVTERITDGWAAATAGEHRLRRLLSGLRPGGRTRGTDVSPAPTHPFATSRITEPLFAFLEGNGYSRRRGFPHGLLGR